MKPWQQRSWQSTMKHKQLKPKPILPRTPNRVSESVRQQLVITKTQAWMQVLELIRPAEMDIVTLIKLVNSKKERRKIRPTLSIISVPCLNLFSERWTLAKCKTCSNMVILAMEFRVRSFKQPMERLKPILNLLQPMLRINSNYTLTSNSSHPEWSKSSILFSIHIIWTNKLLLL